MPLTLTKESVSELAHIHQSSVTHALCLLDKLLALQKECREFGLMVENAQSIATLARNTFYQALNTICKPVVEEYNKRTDVLWKMNGLEISFLGSDSTFLVLTPHSFCNEKGEPYRPELSGIDLEIRASMQNLLWPRICATLLEYGVTVENFYVNPDTFLHQPRS